MAEKSQSLDRGQAPPAHFNQDLQGPRNYTQLHQPPMGQFEGSLGQYPRQYTMPVGSLEPGQRKLSYDAWTAGQREAQSYGGTGRERHTTWSGPPQENWDSSDAERQSDTKSADASNGQDTFDDDIGSSVSTRCSARPKQNTGLITAVPSPKEMMDDHPSYHQSITAKEAERRLIMFNKDCCYLTRYSKAQKCYVLSVFRKQWPDNAIEHLGIVIDDKAGKYQIKGNKDKTFDGIDNLLLHYETRRISPGFPKIGQSYREDEFIQQQQQILDDEKKRKEDEKKREEDEKKKKEEEQKRLIELEQERIKLLKELQEAKDAAEAAEQQKQRDLQAVEDRRRQELQDKQNALETAENNLRAAEERLEAKKGCTIL